MGSVHDPKDGGQVAKVCYIAALIYAGFVAFCGLQVSGVA